MCSRLCLSWLSKITSKSINCDRSLQLARLQVNIPKFILPDYSCVIMSLHKARIKAFEDLLKEEVIDVAKLQQLAFNGIPDDKGLRSLVWKILLHYLPAENKAQEPTLVKKRQLYKQLIDEIIVTPGDPTDHPLNISPDSSWSNFFKDNEVLLQIDKDVRRLCPDISFFQSATEFPCPEIVNSNGVKRLHKRVEQSVLKFSTLERRGLGVSKNCELIKMSPNIINLLLVIEEFRCLPSVSIIRSAQCYHNIVSSPELKLSNEIRRSDSVSSGDYAPLNEGCEAHWEVVERMLFLYAKLNPGQGYVQGMNEIIGPIYHTFATDSDKEFRQHAEADCFFCFTNLMAEIRDFFIRTLDETESGINYMMSKLSNCLREKDPDVWTLMERQELRPQYYSFRWLTLLLSQEFSLPDVERIWDSLFADPQRFDLLIHICCAMIILIRNNLLHGDFACNVKLLQNFPPMDVSVILKKAVEIAYTEITETP